MRQLPIRRRRPGAFTLIELLVVIGVIALLVAILLPVLRASRAQAEMVVCQSNLRQIYSALQMYANDHRDRFPDGVTLGQWTFRTAAGRNMPGRSNFRESYGMPALLHGIQPGERVTLPLRKPRYISGESNVWICPSAPERFSKWGNTYAWSTWNPGVRNPETGKVEKRNPLVDADSRERHALIINDKQYREKKKEDMVGAVTAVLNDNTKAGPGLTGFMGGFSGTAGEDPYTFPTAMYPHVNYRKGYQGAMNLVALNGEIFTQLVK